MFETSFQMGQAEDFIQKNLELQNSWHLVVGMEAFW